MGAKFAPKMLMKLTTGLVVQYMMHDALLA